METNPYLPSRKNNSDVPYAKAPHPLRQRRMANTQAAARGNKKEVRIKWM